MWESLIQKAPAKHDPDATATSISGRIRHYLRSNAHQTAKQVADALGVSQKQANTLLSHMEKTDRVIAALDDSTERTRLTKHYSVRN
jgi:predicted ArsR family transcriptional regulator